MIRVDRLHRFEVRRKRPLASPGISQDGLHTHEHRLRRSDLIIGLLATHSANQFSDVLYSRTTRAGALDWWVGIQDTNAASISPFKEFCNI